MGASMSPSQHPSRSAGTSKPDGQREVASLQQPAKELPAGGPVERELLRLQRLVGNCAVSAMVAPLAIRRQLATGAYVLKEAGALQDDDKAHTALAQLPKATPLKVVDKGGRASSFSDGSLWGKLFGVEHSWSDTYDRKTGWVSDSLLAGKFAEILERLFARTPPPDKDELVGFVKDASSAQRDEAARDEGLLGKAKKALGADAYLELLPALGLHRKPTPLPSATTPTTTNKRADPGLGGHMTGPQADNIIRQQLAGYVAEAVKKGRKVEGEVAVVGDEDFQLAFDRQWVQAAGQKQYVGKKASDICDAFVDVNLPGRKIWVHRNFGDFGTVVHEGMHKYSDSTLRDAQIRLAESLKVAHGGTSKLDEGITEYFTRKALSQVSIPRGNYYAGEFLVTQKLVSLVGEDVVARAYYDGDLPALQSKVGSSWADFAGHFEQGDYIWLKGNGFM